LIKKNISITFIQIIDLVYNWREKILLYFEEKKVGDYIVL